MLESYPNGKKTLLEKEKFAYYEQFLLFPQCFQKVCFPGPSKGVIVWEWVKPNCAFVTNLGKDVFEKMVPKKQLCLQNLEIQD